MNKIFLTVDVECHDIRKKNMYIDGKIRGELWGLARILEIAKEKGIPVNFFVDVVECHEYGDGYIREIVDLIHSYGQKVCLHIHPNFLIPGGYHYFWQYSLEEQKEIIQKSAADFERLVGYRSKAVRTGGYCNDSNYYEALGDAAGGEMTDVSHCTNYRNSHYDSPTVNGVHKNGPVTVLPNTRFLCFKLFGRTKHANLDIMSANMNEMKRVLRHTELDYMTCTMHSWTLFKQWFFLPGKILPDRKNCRKMAEFIDRARDSGWGFSDFDEPLTVSGRDTEIDLCGSLPGKAMGAVNTFFRMQRAARMNKKYFAAYALFYALAAALIILLVCII